MILIGKKLSIIENASPDNVVLLDNISEGVDGSSVFGFTSEPSEIKINDGQTYINRKTNTLDVRVLKPSSSDVIQLKSWASNQTKVSVHLSTIDGVVQFGNYDGTTLGNECTIVINEQLVSEDIFAFKVTKDATVGFDSNTGVYEGGVWAGKNMIGDYEWGDKDGSNVADGWTIVNASASSFSSGQQSITCSTTACDFQRRFWVTSFRGREITFSLTTVSFDVGTYDDARAIIAFYDSSEGFITSQTSSTSTTPERVSVSATVPSNAVYCLVIYKTTANSGTLETVIENPSLRVDGKTTYTKF